MLNPKPRHHDERERHRNERGEHSAKADVRKVNRNITQPQSCHRDYAGDNADELSTYNIAWRSLTARRRVEDDERGRAE